jgi:predicted aldo/keto reductase-like oxidoreductase
LAEQKSVSRRGFLKGAATGFAAAPFLTAASPLKAETGTGSKTERGSLITRTLGRTGLKAPIVALGVMNADNPALVQYAFDKGVRHFDTAAVYQRGQNEAMIGRVLKELGGRKETVIGTKVFVPPNRRTMSESEVKDFYMKTAEESLQRLQTDYLDILYSHNVGETGWLTNAGVLEALRTLKEQGKARFIGFSTHENMAAVIDAAVGGLPYEVILTTYNYSLAEAGALEAALLKAEAKGIGLVAMKTQCQQGWYRDSIETSDNDMYKRYYTGALMNTALLKWALRHPFISWAVPGCTTFAQLDEDMAVASNLDLTPEEAKFLQDRNIKTGMEAVCRLCRECTDRCPRSVDIAGLLRVHMYAASYGNFAHARQVLADIPPDSGLAACAGCDRCLAKCRGRVDIPRRIAELKTIFLG